jgi:hypothetical protein
MQGQEMMAIPGGHTGELHGRKQIKKKSLAFICAVTYMKN